MTPKTDCLPKRRPSNSLDVFAPFVSRPDSRQIRIASNPWLENATLNALMDRKGFLKDFGVDAATIPADGVAGPFDAIAAGEADICMVSGYSHVLPRISQGAPVKVVGAGMRKAALAIFSRPRKVETLADLEGRRIAVGPVKGLLHLLTLQILREGGMDARQAEFVHLGSNEECYRAVVADQADACCASISHLDNRDGLTVITGGKIWEALPRYTFQTAYAADAALKDKHEGFVGVMAAYGALYDYLMTPDAREDYFAARKTANYPFDAQAAQATWDFIQSQRPYCKNLAISDDDIDYLQTMWHDLGAMRQRHDVASLVDMSAARKAAQHLQGLGA